MLANRVHSIFECLQAQEAEPLEIWLPFPEVHDVIRPSVQAPRVFQFVTSGPRDFSNRKVLALIGYVSG